MSFITLVGIGVITMGFLIFAVGIYYCIALDTANSPADERFRVRMAVSTMFFLSWGISVVCLIGNNNHI